MKRSSAKAKTNKRNRLAALAAVLAFGGAFMVTQFWASQPRVVTHGADAPPPGVDIRKSVQPLADTPPGVRTALDEGTVSCDGDGTSGKRVQLLYAHAIGSPSRFDEFAASFQQYAYNANQSFIESGHQSGQPKSVRFVHDGDCNVVVEEIALPAPALTDSVSDADELFAATIAALVNLDLDAPDRKYLVWADANELCGIAQVYLDDRADAGNANNAGPMYGRVDSACWGGPTEAHELMHMMGAVLADYQPEEGEPVEGSPHSTEGLHCTDDYDRMCYEDDEDVTMVIRCPESEENRFDCRKDDYFNTNPPAGSYLDTHWNTADNDFLFNVALDGSVAAPNNDFKAPKITFHKPRSGYVIEKTQRRVLLKIGATDVSGVKRMRLYIDGQLRATRATINLRWTTLKLGRGTHTIMVRAYDTIGNMSQSSITVVKQR